MILEFCAENLTHIEKAFRAGAHRIELCDNLAEGGTTPSLAVTEQSVIIAKAYEGQIAVMIRPRGGNFVYSDMEFQLMKNDLSYAIESDVDAAVFGCLTESGQIHKQQIAELSAMCKEAGIESVFHMAFDQIPQENQVDSLDILKSMDITRLLTRGAKTGPAIDHLDWLNQLIDAGTPDLEILVGGGVTADQLPELSKQLATDQFHGTQVVRWSESD